MQYARLTITTICILSYYLVKFTIHLEQPVGPILSSGSQPVVSGHVPGPWAKATCSLLRI